MTLMIVQGSPSKHALDPPAPTPAVALRLRGVPRSTRLSPRQERVAALVVLGLSNERIAAEMVISLSTTKFHLSELFRKSQTKTRAELSAWYQRQLDAGTAPIAGSRVAPEDEEDWFVARLETQIARIGREIETIFGMLRARLPRLERQRLGIIKALESTERLNEAFGLLRSLMRPEDHAKGSTESIGGDR